MCLPIVCLILCDYTAFLRKSEKYLHFFFLFLQLHKAWLERRAAIKALEGPNNSTRKLYYFNKLLANLKLNASQLQPNANGNSSRKQKKFRTHQNEVILDSTVENFSHPTNPAISTLSDYTTSYPITTPLQLSSLGTYDSDTSPVTPSTYDANVNRQNDFKQKKDKPGKSRRKQVIWSAWHQWSECSRTCGSGVMSQRRDWIR